VETLYCTFSADNFIAIKIADHSMNHNFASKKGLLFLWDSQKALVFVEDSLYSSLIFVRLSIQLLYSICVRFSVRILYLCKILYTALVFVRDSLYSSCICVVFYKQRLCLCKMLYASLVFFVRFSIQLFNYICVRLSTKLLYLCKILYTAHLFV
jgi:hypothetical protein